MATDEGRQNKSAVSVYDFVRNGNHIGEAEYMIMNGISVFLFACRALSLISIIATKRCCCMCVYYRDAALDARRVWARAACRTLLLTVVAVVIVAVVAVLLVFFMLSLYPYRLVYPIRCFRIQQK